MSARTPNSASAPDLFQDFDAEEMREVERVTTTRAFVKGQVIYTPGETGEALFLLRAGAVQIYRMSPEGRKLVIAQLLPHSFFGELSCIGQGMYDTFAEVVEDSVIMTMNCAVLNRLLVTKPEVARRILEAFGRRVLDAERQLEETVFKGIPARVAALLVRESKGDAVDGLTHQDIADRLGVYRETATNALNELKTAGLIEIGRKHIHILDRARLQSIAGE
ncbi:MAG TPA: Crp/Fnr family transcriptional regulator [Pyrinomonadaceae bacterium]|jgi:CRP-like cAMP-binding protein|nr:Crp/Fnr family transcriptional regulator [Pyrinomonadaceae bacterium]